MKLVIPIVVLCLTGCATTGVPPPTKSQSTLNKKYLNDGVGVKSIVTNSALESYNMKYLKASSHKAFAQSVSGAWSWKSDRTSEKHAITSALIACQKKIKEAKILIHARLST